MFAIACASLVANVSVEAQEADVAGTWTLELTLPSGNIFSGTLMLDREGNQISGTWQRDGNGEKRVVRGEIEGKAIAFHWILELRSRSGGADAGVMWSFEGNVEGDTMHGTASLGSRAEDLEWRAQRTD